MGRVVLRQVQRHTLKDIAGRRGRVASERRTLAVGHLAPDAARFLEVLLEPLRPVSSTVVRIRSVLGLRTDI